MAGCMPTISSRARRSASSGLYWVATKSTGAVEPVACSTEAGDLHWRVSHGGWTQTADLDVHGGLDGRPPSERGASTPSRSRSPTTSRRSRASAPSLIKCHCAP
jgi:hypothetical protein